jgi:thiamine biosynthesis lipoprotein
MATDVRIEAIGSRYSTLRVQEGSDGSDPVATAVDHALDVFTRIERECTRFNPSSPLMLLNAHPDRWGACPELLYMALQEAHRAYLRTRGVFDPRVLTELVSLGYDRSLAFADGPVSTFGSAARPGSRRPRWRPRFRGASREVNLGGWPVDLGGIGKGLAIRLASRELARGSPDHLIDAGGDCHCAGQPLDGGLWRVGIEDPSGGSDVVAVLGLRDRACTTSSVRVRRWRAGGRTVHHLIDPRDGRPGGHGLLSVTVVGTDAALSEVLSKALFLAGRRRVAGEAARRGVAACWVATDGTVGTSTAMARHVLWLRR